jgi:hypothetical protein
MQEQNMSRKRNPRILRIATVLTVTVMIGAGAVVGGTPAGAAPLNPITWQVSNSQTSATGIAYTWVFTTATTATISKVEFSVPAGTAGSVSADEVFGLGAGSASLVGTTVTYDVTVPASVGAGTPIFVQIGGFTNTSAPSDYTSAVTTYDTTPDPVDNATSPAVTFGSSTTAVDVTVPQSLEFTNDTPAFQLLPIPNGASVSRDVELTIRTNAVNGYTLEAGWTAGSGDLQQESTSGSATQTTNRFAAQAALTPSGVSGAALAAPYLSSNYVGYSVSPVDVVTADSPTGNTPDSLILTNSIKVDYEQQAGHNTGTVTYTVTPSYS